MKVTILTVSNLQHVSLSIFTLLCSHHPHLSLEPFPCSPDEQQPPISPSPSPWQPLFCFLSL